MNSATSKRIDALARAKEKWTNDLVDVSRRNPLLNFHHLRTGTLDLTPNNEYKINLRRLESLLAGRSVRLSGILSGEGGRQDAQRRMLAIYRTAQENIDEKGIATLFAAIGLAAWKPTDGGKPNAPIILIPLTATPTDATRSDFKLEASGDAYLNKVLTYVLGDTYSVDASSIDDDLVDNRPSAYSGITGLLNQFKSKCSNVPGFEVTDNIVIGNFRYANMPMVADLDDNLEAFADNDLIAAMAGVEEARQALAANISDPSPSQPDFDPPDTEFLIMDADSSQHKAINRALNGESVVIWGPPGTGKSQVIANLIAALIAKGKSVLFVAEKRAAIEVVVARLNAAGLSDLVMDTHGGIGSKREFAKRMADSLSSISKIPEQQADAIHRPLTQNRSRLVDHNSAMHRLRSPWDISMFDIQSRLIGAPKPARTKTRMPVSKARQLNITEIDGIKGFANEWVELKGHELDAKHSEWAQSTVNTMEEARKVLELARRINETLPDVHSRLRACLGEVGLTPPNSVTNWIALLEWLADVERFSTQFNDVIYELDHKACTAALSVANQWYAPIAAVFSSDYRRSLRSVRETQVGIGNKVAPNEALNAVERAAEYLSEWQTLTNDGSIPKAPANLKKMTMQVSEVSQLLRQLTNFLPKIDALNMPYAELERLINRLASSQDVAQNLQRLRELQRKFADAGVDRITAETGSAVPTEYTAAAIEWAWLNTIADEILWDDNRLANFNSTTHNRVQKDFVEKDKEHLKTTPNRIKRAAAESAISVMNTYDSEHRLVRREAQKRQKHISVRNLLRRAPNVLAAIRPCWTMSPLRVAETIPIGTKMFDVVIFDEASQIPPAEAIGSLARAPQAIIAGDDRQLPPTSFFGKQDDDDADDTDDDNNKSTPLTEGMESILDVAKASPLREEMLQWHYRSLDARLIAFSNTHIYNKALTAFPSTELKTPISHRLVPFRSVPGLTSNTSHPDEVATVVDMIIQHARQHPTESLGVIAFGSVHAKKIDDALRQRLSELQDASIEDFFSEQAEERFFVKNIERVQGDERDAIILSVGYHKDVNGRLPYRFGPLNQEGGERRLNVAVTRARAKLHLVSSFSHYDMEPGRSSALGVDLLRRYLEFAASDGAELGASVSDVPLNPFELDVLHRLQDKGIPMTPQYGVAGYRIDFACSHPDQPGRMVMAIESDGASYHSGYTARERDRLRQEALEARGWRFHRIWSTDWFKNKDKEVNKAVKAWKRAVKDADNGYAPQPEPPAVNGSAADTPAPPKPAPPKRKGRRPYTNHGQSIDKYRSYQLEALARWILSDTLLRTDDDLMNEMLKELGFKKRGSRIIATLQRTIDRVRAN